MINKLAMIFTYGLYFLIGYNLLNPDGVYLDLVENYYILYNVIGTVSLAFLAVIMLLVAVGNYAISRDGFTQKDLEKLTPEKIKEAKKAISLSRPRIFLGTLLSSIAGVASFVLLSQYYLGIVLLTQVTFFFMFRSQIYSLSDKVEKEHARSA